MKKISANILGFQEIDKSKQAIAGGKGAHLGELSRIAGIQVPAGFCVTTAVYQQIIGSNETFRVLLDQLILLPMDDRKGISEIGARIRKTIEEIPIPEAIAAEIIGYLTRFDENEAFAVRSSATAEDLPAASFAGQQDTYLNIIGKTAILQHISKCWASLYTDRAIIYRMQNGFNHSQVYLAVVIQQMIFPEAAGIMFTADPVTANRKVVSIDASFGLGEALVAGLVNADHYKVRQGEFISKKISTKQLGIYAVKAGGTQQQKIAVDQQNKPALTDAQVLQLASLGRKIEAHFGSPQDIEWCWMNDTCYIVQSRPVTTLYPIPETNDNVPHVYVSVGHQQMMTDAIKPLGLSFFQLIAVRPMYHAGGRLFVDVAQELSTRAGSDRILNGLGKSDPLIKDALLTLIERGDFIKMAADDKQDDDLGKRHQAMLTAGTQIENDPNIVAELIANSETEINTLQQNIQTKSGTALFDFIREDIQRLGKELFDPRSLGVIITAINAAFWINDNMQEWLGEKNVADVLAQSVSNNVTSEMGLALLDVADVIRPYPAVIAYLQQIKEDSALTDLITLEGGAAAREAIDAYLNKYGMRCSGEIDITRMRWCEKPATLVPLILSNIKNVAPHAGKRKFDAGLAQALQKEETLLAQLKQLPDGATKARETKQKIDLIRNLSGYREYPKYAKMKRYFIYRQALLREAAALVAAGVLHKKEEIYYLTFEELWEVVRTQEVDEQLIGQRKEAYQLYEKLMPPRVLTSDGEIIRGTYKRENIPADALVGLAVSSGQIEGRARVILNMEEADLEAGDILVTAFTDPSWTPLFVSIKGLVTEVGGLMTHGAVIAREYGIAAVVGVEQATKRIKDGQRIRVNGTDGYIEML
ncbi:phosphoenolpyruvate synthase [Chitinophaga nivalis]|uniref:Phosphoenolpyruvate synthase n=1 Tax=Chitinophaga nivalis TaxID=2991709 RepID=A0ABT3IMX1_9BACT|nr:phosphoenolpyruvate synthase [Chitinophaga nivalis]MCW3464979.1 phosphoenolpyruvate synthase [Chitinophaga nivalis]MCW3485329.1 phosphoenolpyruvate synthase [Chitinophaga nivalis]